MVAMRLFALLAAALTLLPTFAVFLDEAYQVDYHHALLGLPQPSATLFQAPFPGSKASLLFTLSEKNVLGAVNPKDGSIVWRQLISAAQKSEAGLLKFGEGQDRIITSHGSTISSWSASDGKLIRENVYEFGKVCALDLIAEGPTESSTDPHDIIAVFQGDSTTVGRLDGETASSKWTYQDSRNDTGVRVMIAEKHAFLISLHAKFKIKVTMLEVESGLKADEYFITSEIAMQDPDDIIFAGASGPFPLLVFVDSSKQKVRLNLLGPKQSSALNVKNKVENTQRISVHYPQQSATTQVFLIHYESSDSHWAESYQIDMNKWSISKLHDFPRIPGKGTFSATSSPTGPYFTRITKDQILIFSSSSIEPLSSWSVDFLRVPGLSEAPHAVDASSEIIVRSESSYAIRSAILLSSGDWILVRNGEINWSRHESLAGTVSMSWADISEKDGLLEQLVEEEEQNFFRAYIHRAMRHFQDLQKFMENLQISTQLLQDAWAIFSSSDSDERIKEQTFGFNKLVIAATDNGRMISLETGNRGRVLWNLPMDQTSRARTKWTSTKVGNLETRLVEMGEHPNHGQHKPSWLALTSYRNPQLHFLNQDSSGFPSLAVSSAAKSTISLISYKVEDGVLHGYKSGKIQWDFHPMRGERIVETVSSLRGEAIASIGKVLGDRQVLYKYLNPNAIVVTAVNDARRKASVYLVDSVSGLVLHSTHHDNVDTSRPFCALISENWYAYSFATDTVDDTVSKGYQIVMTELYESDIPNDRGVLGSSQNYSTTSPRRAGSRPHVISQVFHIPEEITSMAVTQTAQGITSRQLLLGLSGTSSIVAIPRQALDPRRIVGRDAANHELEEGLSRYMPMLDFDPKWYLNHREEILGVKKVLTTPATLESTSLVFAYGIDVFGTRVAPSFAFDILSSSFNKVQLMATVAVLTVGVFFAAPWIQRKQTNALWHS